MLTGIPLRPRPGQLKYRPPEDDRAWPGCFPNEAQATRVYDRAAVQYFREFAKLNIPEEWPPERRQKIYNKYPPHPMNAQRKTKEATVHAATRRRRGGKGKTLPK